MAKKRSPQVFDDASDEDGITVDLTPSRQFKGTNENPVDADTGESLFADLNPRFSKNALLALAEKEDAEEDPEDEEEDEDLEDEEPEERDDLDEPEDDPDEDDEDEDAGDPEAVDSDRPARRDAKAGKWNQRLNRERRLRAEEQENNRELRDRLNKVESQLKAQANDETFAAESSALQAKIDKARAALEQAIEDGESKDQARLNEELLDLKVELKAKQVRHEAAKDELKRVEQTAGGSTIVARKVRQWTRKHPRFNSDPIFASFIRALDKQLPTEGYDPESDEYFKELDKRAKKRYPEEYKDDKDSRRERETPVRRRPPSVQQQRETARGAKPKSNFQREGNKIKLTPRQMQNMRTFQLDPTNKEDVREYVLNNLK